MWGVSERILFPRVMGRENRQLSLLAGFLIAGCFFALLFVGLSYLIPLLMRFFENDHNSRWSSAFYVLSISSGVVAAYRRRRVSNGHSLRRNARTQ
jgi:hypothetical protein